MAAGRKKADRSDPEAAQIPDPVDVVDGLPDRSANPAAWKVVVLILIFAAWVCFLVWCKIAGAP